MGTVTALPTKAGGFLRPQPLRAGYLGRYRLAIGRAQVESRVRSQSVSPGVEKDSKREATGPVSY